MSAPAANLDLPSEQTTPVGNPEQGSTKLRFEACSVQHLFDFARELATSHQIVVASRTKREFTRQFGENADFLKKNYLEIAGSVRAGEPITSDAEWLLDNYYIVEEQIREIREDLPHGFLVELPKLASGEPRVYSLASELVTHTDSALDEETIAQFVNAYQSVAPLSIGETWAVPIMLRLVLVENLRWVTAQIVATRECRQQARRIWESWKSGQAPRLDLSSLDQCAAVVLHLLEQLREEGSEGAGALQQLERQLSAAHLTAHEITHHEHRRQAANQVSIGNIITSMRLISSLDWVQFFERTNPVEQVLRRDPAGVYAEMDFDSRNRYRDAVEQLAKRSRCSEIAIAQQAVSLADRAKSAMASSPLDHIGHWLIDRGREALEAEVAYKPSVGLRWQRRLLRFPTALYFGCTIGLACVFTAIVATLANLAGADFAVIFGLSLIALPAILDQAINLTNLLVTLWLPPRLLPKLEFKGGVPERFSTFVVVPALLSSAREVQSLLDRLEMHYLANSDRTLRFALLSDFVDAAEQHLPGDAELVAQAIAGIRQLNARYSATGYQPFHLFHRERRWNPREGCWLGWERKRGKLMEFNRLLAGAADTSYVIHEGEATASALGPESPGIPFVITVDADTQLPFGSARKLVGAIAHPLNRPRQDLRSGCVTGGYAVVQPRVGVNLASAQRTWFSCLYANHPGLDPYTTAASDVYQDLFGEGSFTGKGIYDVRAFERALAGRFAENQILSHDLIEGCHARVALASDIEVIDSFPARYDAEAKRAHRWARGDWQILPWLLPAVPTAEGWRNNPLSSLSRWKIFDNLRRSLLAPAVMLLLVCGWALWPEISWLTTAVAVATLAFPLLAQAGLAIRGWPQDGRRRAWLTQMANELARGLVRASLSLVFLPHQAVLMIDAIARTLWRMIFSRRKLLEWETAAATERRLAQSAWSAIWDLWYVPLMAGGAVLLAQGDSRWIALPIAALWCASPLVAHLISRPRTAPSRSLLPVEQAALGRIARLTWAFFETHVGPADNWLPPDNLQEHPQEKLAHRVSPTNEGLYLAAVLTARQFGYLGLHAAAGLWENSLASCGKLQRLHGHFYNWYDTQTLEPLYPRYVSTVDSGNLAACLLTVQQGIAEWQTAPVFSSRLWEGLRETIEMVTEAVDALHPRGARLVNSPLNELGDAVRQIALHSGACPRDLPAWQALLETLRADADKLRDRLAGYRASRAFPATDVEPKVESLLHWIAGVQQDFEQLVPWVAKAAAVQALPIASIAERDAFQSRWHELRGLLGNRQTLAKLVTVGVDLQSPLDELRSLCLSQLSGAELRNALTSLDDLAQGVAAGRDRARALAGRLQNLAGQMERMALGMNFQFLYNPARKLFSIGFNLEEEKLDRSHYDMLCSEARLASYLAIAKGDVEPRHWFQLGRQQTATAGHTVLLSWGGTMFEYLMPQLFLQGFEGSLLVHTCRGAVARQQEFGRQMAAPWGVSESAFAALAVNSDYHYRSFGVPQLGLKRGLGDDLVVSPYSTMLALEVAPQASLKNLHQLQKEGGLGAWGMYDAIDYTPERLPAGKRSLVVRCYMAHHHGMSLLAMANLLGNGCIRRWFHNHPLPRSAELLLQERIPTGGPLVEPHADEIASVEMPTPTAEIVSRRITGTETATPRTHLLSNGQLSVMVTSAGGGYCRWRNLAVTRWRSDTTCDNWGEFIYLRDVQTGKVWSATYQPVGTAPDAYEVIYSIDKAEFLRREGQLDSVLEVAVSPENNAEVRQLKLTNHGAHPRGIEVTSYTEVVLATPGADLAHPAFQKLFIETEYIAEETALLARRRAREPGQNPLYAIYAIACGQSASAITFETSRQSFLGRGRSAHTPAALDPGARLAGNLGAVLDPIFALRVTVTVPPHETVTLGLTTAVATSREEALALADQYHDLRNVQRAFELAWAYHQVQLKHLHLSPAAAHLYQQVAAALIFPDPARRGDHGLLLANRGGQSGLWKHGISGDLAMALVHVTQPEHIGLVRELLEAHAFWSSHGLAADLVILNDYPGSYLDALQEQLVSLLHAAPRPIEQAGKVFLLRGAQLPHDDKSLLEAAAAVVLHGDHGPLARQWKSPRHQLETDKPLPHFPHGQRPRSSTPVATDKQLRADQLEFWNGRGGFAADGKEYHILLKGGETTPQPWSNVIANSTFGTLVTESGGGYTWFGNSRENKLTTWSNDPVSDSPSEALYVRDEETGAVWSPLPAIQQDQGEYRIEHGQGYSRFHHAIEGIDHLVAFAVAAEDPIKFIRVRLRNETAQPRRLSVTYAVEWVLGVTRQETQLHLQTEVDPATGALLARNAYHPNFGQQVAFLHVISSERTLTGDRREFLGRHRDWQRPAAMEQAQLSGRTGPGLDPCGAVQTTIQLPSRGEIEVVFLLGSSEDHTHCQQLLAKYNQPAEVGLACGQARARWDAILGAVQIKTPNRALDLLVNRWLLYQVLSCRMWGRSAFYQSGGAYGFRDQLQDSMALIYSRPDLTREHLLRAAARQFEEGDVQHWWHPPQGQGTRTRFSDDLLWLPLVTCHYIRATGDAAILDEVVPFLHSPALAAHEQERYELPTVSNHTASLYEHCRRAIARGFTAGPHGLPLIGCGDWNDGFNLIGHAGQGESVWVGWFLLVLLDEFLPVMHSRGDDDLARQWEAKAQSLRRALEQSGWDGQWYRRAYFDDGTPLGSAQNDVCQIDSIAQSWGVLAGAPPERTSQAMHSAIARLVDRQRRLVLLFTPPFDHTALEPGYVKGYLPGIRENGGQYTHAATWLIQALAQMGRTDDAWSIYDLINPVLHAATSPGVAEYQVEPYVIAADVYGAGPHVGRGGWTWYTGSAAWMYRVAVESLLGLQLDRGNPGLRPQLPADWTGFELTYRNSTKTWRFCVSSSDDAKTGHYEVSVEELP